MSTSPNILVIMFDHQLWYRHGWDGGPRIQRPAFDALRRDATFYENAFSVCPLCGPARRSMLSGVYPHSHGMVRNGPETPVAEETYFDCLRRANYRHVYWGKWHAGAGTAQELGCGGFTPPGYNNPYTQRDYQNYLKERGLHPPKALVEFSESDREYFREGEEADLTGFPNLFSYVFGTLLTPADTHECFYLANRACESLRALAAEKSGRPFLLRVDFWGPHQPYFPTREYLDIYDPAEIPMYGSFADDLAGKPPVYRYECAYSLSRDHELIHPNPKPVGEWQRMLRYAYAQNTMCDAAAERVVDELKRLGLYENTVILWSADHGDALGSHGGHIDKNCYLSEEMLRVPLLLRDPVAGHGASVTAPVSNLDIPATISDCCGEGFRGELHARSLRPYVTGEAEARKYFVAETHGHFQRHTARAVCAGKYRYVYNKGMTEELYDLEEDPYELVNLCGDARYAAVREELIRYLNEWRGVYGDREF